MGKNKNKGKNGAAKEDGKPKPILTFDSNSGKRRKGKFYTLTLWKGVWLTSLNTRLAVLEERFEGVGWHSVKRKQIKPF